MKLTEEGNRALTDIAGRHGISRGASEHLLAAVVSGGGYQAQFNHPELGGMGQWSAGGMTMIGDMFNNSLKAQVADVCRDLAELSRDGRLQQPDVAHVSQQGQIHPGHAGNQSSAGDGHWWPDGLGAAGSTGSQNDMRYAIFPAANRLAIRKDGQVTIYDTGDHRITGFSQQQGHDQSLSFTSQHGPVSVKELQEVHAGGEIEAGVSKSASEPAPSADPAPQQPGDAPSGSPEHDIFTKIERLAALHAKGILGDEEFHAKKRELLDRL
ncbi:SHOCT domain-containing protein [Rhizobium tumorigenes]|uniref:SHOCT domain-containing protein n=1 Tax=Rhizobium tumorigenes TaxID=2041385 RepID=UPI00241FD20A|nr:SHOCT domain-containing protein [Rhizobium tumorigenes]WFS00857.1 SHOCT domain-containing protein [Rhizobium tumorigenes]